MSGLHSSKEHLLLVQDISAGQYSGVAYDS